MHEVDSELDPCATKSAVWREDERVIREPPERKEIVLEGRPEPLSLRERGGSEAAALLFLWPRLGVKSPRSSVVWVPAPGEKWQVLFVASVQGDACSLFEG